MTETVKTRWGFKSKNQLPLFMVWQEFWCRGHIEHATVTFSTHQWWLYIPKPWRTARHFISKLGCTLRIATTLVLARTFGSYVYSVGGACEPDYAVYHWRGRTWAFPTGPVEHDDTH